MLHLGLKDAVSIITAFTLGWSDHINQHSHNHAFHDGLVLGKLLCDIIYNALGYNSYCAFIDAG